MESVKMDKLKAKTKTRILLVVYNDLIRDILREFPSGEITYRYK
jgi:hypothetical protein